MADARTPGGKLRARGLGVPLPGRPGPHNAITDVPGVEVGYTTLIEGQGRLEVGKGPVRTGVTAVLPRGKAGSGRPVFAGCFSLNGNGELTGSHWVEESGQCDGPITITNTHSCGIARDATVRWMFARCPHLAAAGGLPVAGETWDGILNDINGFHVRTGHVLAALDGASSGPLELGSIGGGTGMICYGFKGGNGSASRRVQWDGAREHVLGVFVQANFGAHGELVVAGAPVGAHLPPGGETHGPPGGSVIAVVATDAPLLPHQCKRLARRVSLGTDWYADAWWLVDAYLRFDLAQVSGRLRAAEVSLVANNLLDRTYLSTIAENYAWLGAPRTISMNVSVSF